MERYEVYKDSGVEWIGKIPSSWNVQRFRWTLKRVNRAPLEDDEIVTCFRDGEVTLRRNRREDGFTMSDKEIGYQHICAGDFVIHGMDGFAGAMGISDSDGKASPVLMAFQPAGSHDLRFINYLLRLYAWRNVFLALSTTIRVRSCDLNWAKVAPLPLVLPSFNEQQAIADYLDAKTAEVDALVADCECEVELLREYRKAVISEAVTKGLDPDAPMKDSDVEWIGKRPLSWSYIKLGYTFSRLFDIDHWMPESVDVGYPYLMIGDLKPATSEIDFSSCKHICEKDYLQLADKGVPKHGDVIIARYATIGTGCFVDSDEHFVVTYACLTVTPQPDMMRGRYLLYYTQSEAFERELFMLTNSNTQGNVGKDSLSKAHILLPPIEEQDEIVSVLDAKIAEIDSLIEDKQQMADKLREYRKSLISEVVTGKFKVQAA